jgi:hypothetical protein
MNNEFVKIKYEPKPSLLLESLRRKQQQSKCEILQFSEGSCAVSVMIYVFAMRRMQFSLRREETVSYNGSYALKYAYCLLTIK